MASTVSIFKAHNIVFVEIPSTLNFDQLKIELSWVLKPMNYPDRNIC